MMIHPGADVFRPGTTVVFVMSGGCRCWAGAKHPERTHVKLRGEASLRRGKCGGQYKRELILPRQRASFSGDVVECLSWSRKLNNSERSQHLDGCPLHVTVKIFSIQASQKRILVCSLSVWPLEVFQSFPLHWMKIFNRHLIFDFVYDNITHQIWVSLRVINIFDWILYALCKMQENVFSILGEEIQPKFVFNDLLLTKKWPLM
jgi:hypothetical protein